MAKCKSCQMPVFFAVYDKTGRTMIVDAKPQQRLVVVSGDPDDPLNPVTVRVTLQKTYVDHHATCPKAELWRKPKPEQKP